jgi:hypothetical protein
MITVGLINELRFISKSLRIPVSSTIKSELFKSHVDIHIKEQVLDLWYLGYHIWKEPLDDVASMFGVESCDNIYKILALIDKGDDSWRELRYIEKLP